MSQMSQTRFSIRILGKIWMPCIEAATEINVSDWELSRYTPPLEMTIDDIESYMYSHTGDFSQILDYEITIYSYPMCPTCLSPHQTANVIRPWKNGEDSDFQWSDIMFPMSPDEWEEDETEEEILARQKEAHDERVDRMKEGL